MGGGSKWFLFCFIYNVFFLKHTCFLFNNPNIAEGRNKWNSQDSRRNFCQLLSQNKNSVFILITFSKEIPAPHSVQPLGHAAKRLFAALEERVSTFPWDVTITAHFRYLYTECLYSQNNFSEMCFPMRSLILIFHIRMYLLLKRLTSLPTRKIVKHFMNTEGFLCKQENENTQGKICSKAIRKNYVPFNSCHGTLLFCFPSTFMNVFNVILFYFYD